MLSILSLGFLIGLRHTLEADHVCAVAALTARTGSVRRAVPLGLLWGAGHTLALSAFGMAAIMMEAVVPKHIASFLELAVGAMLIALGIEVLFRLNRKKIHFHTHTHEGGEVHFHAHAHVLNSISIARNKSHNDTHALPSHNHQHPRGLKMRAFLIGIMHGMAGSAVLIALTIQNFQSVANSVVYIAIFGAGSMLGMAVLSAAIAWPLWRWGRTLTRINDAARAGLGILTIVFGSVIVYKHWILI